MHFLGDEIRFNYSYVFQEKGQLAGKKEHPESESGNERSETEYVPSESGA